MKKPERASRPGGTKGAQRHPGGSQNRPARGEAKPASGRTKPDAGSKRTPSDTPGRGGKSPARPGAKKPIGKPKAVGGKTFGDKRHYQPKRKQAEHLSGQKEDMRLNRFIATAGICSRREADKFIEAGLVSINGKVVTELGTKVKAGDEVRYNGELIRAEKKVYLLLNKPKGFITTMDDPRARKTVMDLVGNACSERIYPVGRLDRATTGVLLFTNDGDMAKKLTHPSHGARKIYSIHLDRNFKRVDFDRLMEGIELDDGPIRPDSLSYADEKAKNHIGIELHSGRNRIVRRIFEYLGYEVITLDRTSFAGLTKKQLKRGQYRFLRDDEINFLKTR